MRQIRANSNGSYRSGSRSRSRSPAANYPTPGDSGRGRALARHVVSMAANRVLPGSGPMAGVAFDTIRSLSRSRSRSASHVSPDRSHANKKRNVDPPAYVAPKRIGYHTQGRIGGKFSKKLFKNSYSTYCNKGVFDTFEVTGTVADLDCVYIAATAIDSYRVIQHIVVAMVRKLFQKVGYNITNCDDILGYVSLLDANNWQVDVTFQNVVTGAEFVGASHVTGAASTVNTISQAFYDVFRDFSAGGGRVNGVNHNIPWRIILYRRDNAVTPAFACCLNFSDEIIHLKGHCDLKIQNRTIAANGSTSTEDISNNPLVGYSYRFKTTPRPRDKKLHALSSLLTSEGIRLVRSASITDTSVYKEPPLPNHFSNCVGSSKISLEPGQIKRGKVSYQKSMHFVALLKKIALQYDSATGAHTTNSPFPCELFAFEDLINVNGNQNIAVAYEANFCTGVYLKTNKRATGVSTFAAAVVNDLPT